MGAIQVCDMLDDSNREREINGLLEVMNKFKLKEGIILTYEQEEDVKVNGKVIKFLPVWKWLLQ